MKVRTITSYLMNMIPYIMLAVPVYLIARIVFVKAKKLKTNRYRETALFVLVILVVGVISQTVIPEFDLSVNGFHIVQKGVHRTNLKPFKVLFETYQEVFVNQHIHYFLINFLGNIILFIPFGLLIPLLWKTSMKKTLLIGLCFSLFIEICQLFLARGTDVDDLILNTAGVLSGVLIYKFLQKHFKSFVEKFR